MSQYSFNGELRRPVAPQVKWWLVGSVFIVLGAWELAFHLWLMDLPIVTGHRVNALIGASLVAMVVLATFGMIQRYERSLADAAVRLREKTEALRTLEAERDTRVVKLARDLALALVEIDSQCDIALGLSEPRYTVETLGVVKQRVADMGQVARGLIEMKQNGSRLVEPLPAILDEYEQHREELLKNREWYLRYLKEHPGFAELMASLTGRSRLKL